ncbi:Phosphatidylinositol (PI) 3-kinase [Cryptotrichosporon argae]
MGDSARDKDFSFAKLCDVKEQVALRIGSLEGDIPRRTYSDTLDNALASSSSSEPPTDLYVTVQLFTAGVAWTLAHRTQHKDAVRAYTWNQAVVLPVTYPSLQRDSQLAFTVWACEQGRAVAVGGSTMRLFGANRTLKKGQQRLYVHRGVEADPRAETTTPSDPPADDEMGRLEALVKDYERGDIEKVDWLDRLAFRQIESVHAAEAAKSDKLYLYVDLPRFDFPIIWAEKEYAAPLAPQPTPRPQAAQQAPPILPPDHLANDAHLWKVYDPDSWRENPVEIKHRKMLRSQRLGEQGRDLKPGPADRDRLNEIFRLPPTAALSPNDKDLLWKFRFSLFRSPRSLTKFLKCVTWTDPVEATQAVDKLLPLWGAEVGMDDALELLGPGFTDRSVRAFAVRRLMRADDEELLLYLLQLVQALKFDMPREKARRKQPQADDADSGLAQFLIDRGVANPVFGTSLHWYLMIECDTRSAVGKMYAKVAFGFMKKLSETPEGTAQREVLKRQGELVDLLSARAKEIRASKDARSKKIDKLRGFLGDAKNGLSPLPSPLPLPLDPRVSVTAIAADKSSVFKSNLFPLLLWFETDAKVANEAEDGGADDADAEAVALGPDYPVIFKNGDDLRQDQLVIQLFTLMDRLLRRENLDLRLSPYSVLATGAHEGMIQFVPSLSLAAIVAQHGSVHAYLRARHADESALGSYGIDPAVMDTYVRSCAGYAVLTYVLGVGDRHLDNLMLSPDGRFFHVDFGYILGRDPKPYPPPVKVAKEMVDAMGGTGSAHYARFQSFCFTAFIGLRKNANLILNLVGLMVDAGIQDIQLEPDKAVWKVQEKFMLDLSEEDAIKQFEALLNDTSYLTVVFDRIHDWAQYLRD